MDQTYSTTNLIERKRGQHLGAEERGAIQALKKQGYSNRAIGSFRYWLNLTRESYII